MKKFKTLDRSRLVRTSSQQNPPLANSNITIVVILRPSGPCLVQCGGRLRFLPLLVTTKHGVTPGGWDTGGCLICFGGVYVIMSDVILDFGSVCGVGGVCLKRCCVEDD